MTSWRIFAATAAIVAALSTAGCGFGGDDNGCMANPEMGVSCAVSSTTMAKPTTTTAKPSTTQVTTTTVTVTTAVPPVTHTFDDGTIVVVTIGADGKPTTETKRPPTKTSSVAPTTTTIKPSPTTTTTTRVTTTTTAKPSPTTTTTASVEVINGGPLGRGLLARCNGPSVAANSKQNYGGTTVEVSADGRAVIFSGTGLTFVDMLATEGANESTGRQTGLTSSRLQADGQGQRVKYTLTEGAVAFLLCATTPVAAN